MSNIEILPARLANQIAAGEVVERPASVIKELIENSLDAGATKITIEVEKGGIKKLRISDNGKGIVKDELTLALSRHATSKIKDLKDLEGIASLGFRGEALASISSVSRLTLTSKPKEQDTAWQASAEGRDMKVSVQPAAHPDGTTIEVNDLFFNTPARRKFLRTEKTEFNHIDEIIRRIALARFDVAFTLSHNGKMVRQYRIARDKTYYDKRVGLVCGQRFLEHAIKVDCQHGDLHLWGWLGKPSFVRNQNDLCYSYVNGRMMRDKLINHAIRQAYADLLPLEGYPAFVLFLTLDHREVDVNVHPAKHEVRFHQGRYVHDFIYSVCQRALQEQTELLVPETGEIISGATSAGVTESGNGGAIDNRETGIYGAALPVHSGAESAVSSDISFGEQQVNSVPGQYSPSQNYGGERAYVKPLTSLGSHQGAYAGASSGQAASSSRVTPSAGAVKNYQQLMTPYDGAETRATAAQAQESPARPVFFKEPEYAVITLKQDLRLLSLTALAQAVNLVSVQQRWQQGLIRQPLLLPVQLSLPAQQFAFAGRYQQALAQAGIIITFGDNSRVQIREFPAMLREKDVSASLLSLLSYLEALPQADELTPEHWQQGIAKVMQPENFTENSARELLFQAQSVLLGKFEAQLLLNSVELDLTSAISQLG
ncbi:DNA mismatch repair endonuclease MutL [Thalassomonas actiniarum]|uniref:DNA mismatch repair protein MutL n=1 Tax=Thalassomonas actiniarum TaxID=485447 RepID=A0AAF0C484_9GAMM|nr:DNA mismatch repair endonuclease MutL [Thalassomonas actiniarum]WDD99519.1 DNA mismatch repair endonuclease MutL [Thalassomonas actiniarum]